jgi:hypothetical protein
MQRLKRVFAIDIETCSDCGGTLRVIACIEEPPLIAKILWHIQQRAGYWERLQLPSRRRFRWFRGRQSRICGQKQTPDTCRNA